MNALHEFSDKTESVLYTNGFIELRVSNPDFKMASRYLILKHASWYPGINENESTVGGWVLSTIFNNLPTSEFSEKPQLALNYKIWC